LIVEDEPVARQTIRLLLESDPDILVIGECANGVAAAAFMRNETPDLLFLDVQMPGLSGFDVLKSLDQRHLPAVIFTTAFDQYAVKAFEVHALDYLLKPFDDERFQSALMHAKRIIREQKVGEVSQQLLDLLERFSPAGRPPIRSNDDHKYLPRLMIRSGGRLTVVDVRDVEWIEAEGNYVSIHSQGKSHLLRQKISALEAQLDPSRFARIHRSIIIRTDLIKSMKPLFNGDHSVTMLDGREFTMSRTYRDRVLSALGDPVRSNEP
jgi:two-component system LytT family response regulator